MRDAGADRERLVIIQNYLVDLLEYLEKKEGFSLAHRKRQRATVAPPLKAKPVPSPSAKAARA